MVQFLSIIFFLGFLQFLFGVSKVPVFLCYPVHILSPRRLGAGVIFIHESDNLTLVVNLL